MEKHINSVRIANYITMNTSCNNYKLIVEGENDYKIYRKCINESNVTIIQAFGKDNVEEVLNILKDRGYDKCLGIVDSDFDNIIKIENKLENLFKTDNHDLEMMIIKSDALENVVHTLCNFDKIKDFESKKSLSIREQILILAKEIGKLKLINKKHNLGLSFKPKDKDGKCLKYKKIINEKDLSFMGLENLINKVLDYQNNRLKGITNEQLKELYLESEYEYDIYDLVNGHDIANLLFICMKNILKSKSTTLNDYTSIEDLLICSYDISNILHTDLYNKLLKWEIEKNIDIVKFKDVNIVKSIKQAI